MTLRQLMYPLSRRKHLRQWFDRLKRTDHLPDSGYAVEKTEQPKFLKEIREIEDQHEEFFQSLRGVQN